MTTDDTNPRIRWLRFKYAVGLRKLTLSEAARYLGVSYNHMALVIKGERRGSIELQEKVASILGEDRESVFPNR